METSTESLFDDLDMDNLFDDIDLSQIEKPKDEPAKPRDPWILKRNKLIIFRKVCLACGTEYSWPGSHMLLEREHSQDGSKHASKGFRADLPTVHVTETLDPVEACQGCFTESEE